MVQIVPMRSVKCSRNHARPAEQTANFTLLEMCKIFLQLQA